MNKKQRFVVWVRDYGTTVWEENGDGALSEATCIRIAAEVRHHREVDTAVIEEGVDWSSYEVRKARGFVARVEVGGSK